MELGEIIKACPAVLYSRRSDGEYGFTTLSEQAETLFGLNRDTWLQEGGGWLEEIHEQDRSRVLEALATVPIEKQQQVRYRLRTDSGDYRWIRDDMRLVDGGEAGPEIAGCWIDITEQQDVEMSLRADEHKYRELVENADCIIVQMDIEGRITFLGKYAEAFFGYSCEEIIGCSILDTIVPSDQMPPADFAELIAAFKADPENFAVTENQNIKRDGQRAWVAWTNRAILDETGDVVGVLSIGRDVTERKLAEAEIAQLAKFPGENPNPVLRISSDGVVLYNNAASARLLEAWQAEGTEGLPEIWLETIGRAVETGTTQRFEGEYDDTVFSFTVASVADAGYVNVYGDDVTERNKARRGLQDTLQFNESIISSAGDGIVVYDRQKNYVVWNPAMEELTGVPATNVLGRRALTPYAPSAREGLDALLDRALTGETVETGERQYRVDASGRAGWVEIMYTPLRDIDDAITGVIGIVRDVTEQKRAEQEIQQLNAELERRVAQRTAELEAANRELEAFTYSVSHDLRAPLRGMDGFSQILLEDYAAILDDQGKDYLNRVRAASQRMALLIDDLLKLSRVTRSELRQQRVNLSELARTVMAELESEEPERSASVTIEEGMAVQGDKQLMQLVLENLLGNAWKFTHEVSDAAIEFGTMEIDGERSYFVRDNGAGFDMAYGDKLFQPFQRLHTEEEFPGTGIGLATVQRIINRHGGKVWAEGTVDDGAVFYFTLAIKSRDGK